jgi:hypothetical protein
MYPTVRLGLAALIIVIASAWSTAQAGESVVGSWRLVSWVQEDVESKAVQAVFGDLAISVAPSGEHGQVARAADHPQDGPAHHPPRIGPGGKIPSKIKRMGREPNLSRRRCS